MSIKRIMPEHFMEDEHSKQLIQDLLLELNSQLNIVPQAHVDEIYRDFCTLIDDNLI